MTPVNRSSKANRTRRWLMIAGGAVAFVLLLGLILPLFINVDRWRPDIVAAIAERTGREVTLGKIHARLLPTAAIVVDGFQLGNPKDFGGGNLLSVVRIHAGVTLLPLLGGHIHITSVTLDRPELNLTENQDGHTNYTFPKETKSSARGAAGGTEASSGFSLDKIESVTLDNAEVTLEQIPSRGSKPFRTIAAHKVNVSLGNITLDADAVKQWQGEANLGGVSVEMGALAVPVEFDSGKVKLGGGVLDADFRFHAGKIADARGKLHVADVTNAITTFEISTPELNADALLASIRSTPETRRSAGTNLTNEFLAQGKITAERVAWSPYLGGNANAEIKVYGDRMEVMPASMVLYGGTLQFTARTDARQTPERFSANLRLTTLDLGRMLAVTTGRMKGKMTGLAELDLQMFGSTGGVWQKSLTGSGKFSIRDGKLPGVNLAGALGSLAKAAGMNETSFSLIAGDLGIGDARVTTKETKMDSSSGTVILSGGFSLLDQSMSFDGKATLAPSGAGAIPVELITGLLGGGANGQVTSITVPFSLRGTLSDPHFLPGKGIPSFGTASSSGKPGDKTNAAQDAQKKLLGGKH
jgi:hypothetical protein